MEKWGENTFSLSAEFFSFGFLISPCIFLFQFWGGFPLFYILTNLEYGLKIILFYE